MEKGVPIRSISRSIAVLQAINRAESSTMMEIAQASRVPYPTACRIVQTLLHEGLIEREPARKRYRPTALVQTLSHGYQGHGHLVTTARPHIVALTKRLGWPVSLTTQVGLRMVVRDCTHALTTQTFSYYYPGYSLPILECASGCAYLAYAEEEERRTILDSLRNEPGNETNNTLALFESGSLIRSIRQDGYATKVRNRHTRNPGKTSSIAVPVMDGSGGAIGAITLVYFSSSMTINDAVAKYLVDVRQTAAEICDALAADGLDLQAA